MATLTHRLPASKQGWRLGQNIILSNLKTYLISRLVIFTLLFTLIGKVLVWVDPTAGILDIGILTIALFGLLVSLAAVLCSLWLQELLWQPFKVFRKDFLSHFNQLTSWQQCILYFSVFFLLLFAVLKGVEVVF
ncbi:hypothetical protein [Sphingobacterium yanglingense]|uniref:Uncharacterized protein n=1 Tax=Sphingobacterium yanglingense TaxID=1437280 RepID=A0A4R6WLQ7_9SPHI|nr:hypothetical protein [Sphingobacterium yanglingense]TDQ79728.1 hypothetical protein CLV99_1176 [Sphingobacterium yanglingense]